MIWIGITGGIGSGKSTVAKMLGKLGVPVIDSDAVSREQTAGDGPVMDKIVATFGEKMRLPDGSLNRDKMREEVQKNPKATQMLEDITHPAIFEGIRKLQEAYEDRRKGWIRCARELDSKVESLEGGDVMTSHPGSPYGAVEIPLLYEAQEFLELVDRVLVVDADDETRVRRVVGRGRQSEEQARKFIAMQSTREQRFSIADDILHNNGHMEELERDLWLLHQKYVELAHGREGSGSKDCSKDEKSKDEGDDSSTVAA